MLLWAEEYLVSYQFSVSGPYLRSEHYEKVILVCFRFWYNRREVRLSLIISEINLASYPL